MIGAREHLEGSAESRAWPRVRLVMARRVEVRGPKQGSIVQTGRKDSGVLRLTLERRVGPFGAMEHCYEVVQ